MSSSTTTRAAARGATAKGQVPRPRGQRPRQPAGQANTERPHEPARRGGIAMPAVPIPRVRIPGNVLWWGGLAAVAALGIVDWPVAALVGAGTLVAQQRSSQSDRGRSSR